MPTFTLGEEVLFNGTRYVVTLVRPAEPYQYRLVASTADGARVAWATRDQLHKIDVYREPKDDTARY